MPTISPVVRATIGGSPEDFKQPRASVTTSTGMNLPSLKQTEPAPETGQSDIKEETPAQAVTLSPQLTALARKQQKLQQEIQAQRDREAAFSAKEADYVPKSSFKAKLQQNAAEALKDLGVDYEELTNLLLQQQQGDDPVKAVQAELAELKKAQEESVNKQFDATVRQYQQEAKKLITSGDKYLLLQDEISDAESGALKGIVDQLVEDFNKDGEVQDLDFYLQLAEEGLRDEAKRWKARADKLEPKPVETAPDKKTLPPPKSAPRTLTQSVEATPTRTYNQFQHLSMKERIAQAVARAQK